MDWTTTIENLINKSTENVVEVEIEKRTIKYSNKLKLHRNIKTLSGDEELVRAYLIDRLVNVLDYKQELIEIEKEYEAGRPKTIKPRIDVILRDSNNNPFFFIEVKSPDKYESDKRFIEGQLYQLAKLEGNSIKYLVYYTVDFVDEKIIDKAVIIDYQKYPTYEDWVNSGYLSFSTELSEKYNKPQKPPLIKGGSNDLKTNFNKHQLISLAKDLHNVLWGGGGTSDNEIFSSLVNIILVKIQDESDKDTGENYDFQVFQYGDEYEKPDKVFDRINQLYRKALQDRLFIHEEVSDQFVINRQKFPLNKLLYAVQQLEKYSFVDGKNSLDGKDILGDFFEEIIREGFKQTKGQFFTPINVVNFILYAIELDTLSIQRLNEDRELPFVIDPSCGSGTFLLEAMKVITKEVKYRRKNELKNTRQVKDRFDDLFKPDNKENKWARDYLYGIEHNFDLGTATKVNMILHGDGSSNIFVKSGLLPFRLYEKAAGTNLLKFNQVDILYKNLEVNNQFDVIVTNPPFSVNLDDETARHLGTSFIFNNKSNSENLFVERYYQILKEKGRLGVVLPDSVFDTTENKYIRLFLYKYFNIKAVISLPQLTFEPYTSTKTSLLFAQKKTLAEVELWNDLWLKYSNQWSKLKTRVENYINLNFESP